MKLEPYLIMTCAKIKTIKLLEENIGRKLHDIGFGNEFLDMTQNVQAPKKKNREIGHQN